MSTTNKSHRYLLAAASRYGAAFGHCVIGTDHRLAVICRAEEGRREIERLGGNYRLIDASLTAAISARPSSSSAERRHSSELCDLIRRLGGIAGDAASGDAASGDASLGGADDVFIVSVEIRRMVLAMMDDGSVCAVTREALRDGGLRGDVALAISSRIVDDMDVEAALFPREEGDPADGSVRGEGVEPPIEASGAQQDRTDDARDEGEEEGDAPAASALRQVIGASEEQVRARRHVRGCLRDLSALSRSGRLDPVIGRDGVIDEVLETLAKRRKPCVLLVGEAGVGKTAIAEGVAQKMKGRDVLEISVADLMSGARYRGDLEARVSALIAICVERRAVLFIDEFHALIGGGSGGLDAGNLLKPAMARGQIAVIGATTPHEMREIRKDAALMRRLSMVRIDEPTATETREIIGIAVGGYAVHHGIGYAEDALDAAVALAQEHLPAQRFPDKALDIVDLAGVVAMNDAADEVEVRHVTIAVERLSGLPVAGPSPDQRKDLAALEGELNARVFGQEAASAAVARAAKLGALGLRRSGVASSFLFNGPTRTGKTAMAKAMADAMRLPMVRIDMSEVMEKHAVSRLIGAPPGYVGFAEGGLLTAAVDAHPRLVLLLDEIDKAHPDAYDLLLQILDAGRLTGADGVTRSFRGVHLVMTSNIGVECFGMGFNASMTAAVDQALSEVFRKELRARIGAVIQFRPLAAATLGLVAERELGDLAERARRIGVDLTFCEGFASEIVKGVDGDMGAAGVVERIMTEVGDVVAEMALSGRAAGRLAVDAAGRVLAR